MAVVIVPAALALALCLYELATRSLWLDEAATISIASQHGAAFGNALAHDGGNMLAYYGLVHVLISAFGHGVVVVRLAGGAGLRGHRRPDLDDRAAAVGTRARRGGRSAGGGVPGRCLLGTGRAGLTPMIAFVAASSCCS